MRGKFFTDLGTPVFIFSYKYSAEYLSFYDNSELITSNFIAFNLRSKSEIICVSAILISFFDFRYKIGNQDSVIIIFFTDRQGCHTNHPLTDNQVLNRTLRYIMNSVFIPVIIRATVFGNIYNLNLFNRLAESKNKVN